MSAPRRPILLVAGLACAIALAGCGASATIGSVIDPTAEAATVVRAALRTDQIAGFRIRATLMMAADGSSAQVRLAGVMDTRTGIQDLTERIRSGRHTVSIRVLSRGGRVYMNLRGLPGIGHALGTRPWLEYDIARSEGIADPSAHYDPAEFVDFLRTPGMQVQMMASQAVDGVPATLYRATINLDGYLRAAPRRLRSSTRRLVDFVEQAVGSHVLPEDVWVDASGLIRQISWGYTECVAGQSISAGMLIDFSDFGAVRAGGLPAAAHTRDISPMIRESLGQVEQLHAGCGSAAPA